MPDVPPWLAPLLRTLGAQLIETHISWVLLTRDTALKIKKPVRLPFVDYGTLEARRHFCEEEVRLNSRLAPSLYLGVARITGTHDAPALDAGGEVLDYAVRMRRFAPGALFSERLAQGALEESDIDALGDMLARFHAEAPVAAADTDYGTGTRRRRAALAALQGAAAVAGAEKRELLAQWLVAESARLEPFWEARVAHGRVRECHGDLHLANVVHLEHGVAAFDGIEFDPALRWIDVVDDVAFAVMDLAAQERRDFAFRLLNRWLDGTGDHAALPGLRFALVYRALVRAEVEALQRGPRSAQAQRYFRTALECSRPGERRLTIMHGLPASGKTWASQRLLQRQGAIRLRSDVERKRLFGLAPLTDSRTAGVDIYTLQATEATYRHLFAMAQLALDAAFPVILDAAFLKRDERRRAREFAQAVGAQFTIAACEAPAAMLRDRLLARRGDASEADVQVLDRLQSVAEPLTPEERAFVNPQD